MNIWKIAIVFLAFNQDNTDGVFPKTTVKSLFEDDRGDIWIGTWSQGLFRYEKRTGKYWKYPQMNSGNSAHVVFQDSHKNIWVGTDNGLNCIIFSASIFFLSSLTNFPTKSNKINELYFDPSTHLLWIATDKGITWYDTDSRKFIAPETTELSMRKPIP